MIRNLPIISGRKIKIGVVGCGRISKNHLQAISTHYNDFDLTAVCDIDKRAFSTLELDQKVVIYHDLSEMLMAENLDVITICTPSGLHSEQTIIAAQHGVHVICEKPMATRYMDGLRMVKACDQANVRLFVVKQNRLNSTLKLLKSAVSEGRFGAIKLVQINVFWTRPQSYYDHGMGWRGTWEFDGGAFMNQASHYVDLADWLIGPVEKVQAFSNTSRMIEAEDTGVLNLKWRNGALGSMAVTMLTYPQNLEGSITILGENGTVKVGGVAVNEIQAWDFVDERDYDAQVKDASYETTSVYGFGHTQYYENVISVLRGDLEPETDGREGLKSLELLTATYLAARDNKTIGLPLNLMGY
jgi:UDP-N-acetyl-2-amino-2-deoxyglucuronate dehydrogenase